MSSIFAPPRSSISILRRALLLRQCPQCALEARRHKSINEAIYRGRNIEHRFPSYQRFVGPDSPYEERTMFVKKKRHIERQTETSEFLFGSSVILAALTVKKRRFYTLFVYEGEEAPAGKRTSQSQRVIELAREAGVRVKVRDDSGWFDAITNSRPHNGVILECEKFRTPLVESLPVFHGSLTTFRPRCKSTNEWSKIQIRDPDRKYPFVLVLDEIVDGGNLGAILRSAYFFGVDAVILNTKKSAPITAVASKTSSGASEVVPVLEVDSVHAFVQKSTANGWVFYGAMPPPPLNPSYFTNSGTTMRSSKNWYDIKDLGDPLSEHPVGLVFGNEGLGLGYHICEQIGRFVTVSPARYTDTTLLDSLNVSVSAAVLCERFLQAPRGAKAASFWDRGIISKIPREPYQESDTGSVPRIF